jgi:hypothetical protein
MALQRPRLLDSLEEDESAGVDTAGEINNDVLEEHNDRVTSIVIANLTGELPSQFSLPSSHTIFVTNTGQILTNSVTDSELQERQHEALNVLLEQLQSTGSYRSGSQVQFGSEAAGCFADSALEVTDNSKVSQKSNRSNILKDETQENVFPANGLPEKDTDLVLTDANMTTHFDSLEEEEEEEEETQSDGVVRRYKPETVTALALNPQQNSRENFINIMNTHVTIIHDSNMMNSEDQAKSAHDDATSSLTTESIVVEPEIHKNIFKEFRTSNVVSEEMLPKNCSESIHSSLKEEYRIESGASIDMQAGRMNVISSNNEDCIINSGDLETVATSNELRLSVEQEDVSSAFLELVSEPSFDTTNDENLDKCAGNVEGQENISLPASFDLDAVSDGTVLLPADNTKIMDPGPPYNCDICNKEFHKADYLYRHLRKHTGEFTCVSCLAVFARKESLMNHSCFADTSGVREDTSSFICPYCQKKFHVKKLFKRHVAKHKGTLSYITFSVE